jgi:putative tryptophan/tyrosine transport system substrate-binding protein
MKRVFKLVAITLVLAWFATDGEAQQAGKVFRIGYLSNSAVIGPLGEVFKKRLQDLGYADGRNLTIAWAFAKGDRNRVPGLVAELVNLKVDCIVAGGVALTRAAKQATGTIPIIMANADDDPVQQGLVASLARPGGNVTGFINIGSDLAGKRLELLKEIVPKATRVAILSSGAEGAVGHVRESQAVAPALSLQVQVLEVPNPDAAKIERAFKSAVTERVNALVVVTPGGIANHTVQIASLAAKTRLPAMYTVAEAIRDGGLVSYGDDALDRLGRVAEYVDRILKGTKPADLPVQRPVKFELIVNLNAAKQIGLTIPPNVLARADRVVK